MINNKLNIRHIVFDLDGTLVSSHVTIYQAAIKTLEHYNINRNQLPEVELYKRIGMHFQDIFDELNIKIDNLDEFISIYKKIYFEYMNESYLYPDVEKTISLLKEKEISISLLTTKGQDQAEAILKYFNIDNYFNYIMGRRPGIAHKPSPEPLIKICEDLSIPTNETLMVGDSELDILCGKDAGSKTAAVTYGYREKSLLESYKPDLIINGLGELNNNLILF